MQTEAELVALMQQGIANRRVAATGANMQSSRSHCLVLLAVERLLPDGSCVRGKLCLVDLAGGAASMNAVVRAQHGMSQQGGYPCLP